MKWLLAKSYLLEPSLIEEKKASGSPFASVCEIKSILTEHHGVVKALNRKQENNLHEKMRPFMDKYMGTIIPSISIIRRPRF